MKEQRIINPNTAADLNAAKNGISLIENDDKVKAQKCAKDIEAILEAYGCQIVPIMIIRAGRTVHTIEVIPKPRSPEELIAAAQGGKNDQQPE